MDYEQRILIVDDRPENLLALEKTLVDVDAKLVRASSGEEALAATLQDEFALAILDVQMPEMDGYELAELLRGDPKTRHIPIIFLTAAYREDAQIFKGYESGAVEYIVKPYNPDILVSKVRILLEMDRGRKELKEHRDHLDRLVAERTAELAEVNRELLEEIEERKKAETNLEEAVSALRRSNEELEQFTYVSSHDLQEPLRMVTSYIQLLEDRYGDSLDDRAKVYLGYAVEGATRMRALINDLLTFSRIGTRGKPPQPTDSGEALADVLRDMEFPIEDAGAEIIVGDMPMVMADSDQLREAFRCLLSNAIKFRGDSDPRVEVDAKRVGARWEISVTDNGIGIEERYHDRVFVIFQRLHARDDYPGTGIGLSVLKKIVERHGGEVGLESVDGQGSRFSFTMAATK